MHLKNVFISLHLVQYKYVKIHFKICNLKGNFSISYTLFFVQLRIRVIGRTCSVEKRLQTFKADYGRKRSPQI